MASGFHLVLFLSVTSGLFITETMSQTDETEGCPEGWTRFGKRCFMFYHMQKSWTDAERTCVSIGGNLASVHSAKESSFLRNLILRVSGYTGHTWIGGTDAVKEGTWMWSDGSPFDYRRWGYHEPNNWGTENCIEMNYGGNYWNDMRCYANRHFVCARDMPQ